MAFKMPSHEEFKAEFARLKAEEAAILKEMEPIQKKYDAAHAKVTAIEVKELRPVGEELKAIKRDRLMQVQNDLGRIVRYLRSGDGVATTGEVSV